jgi:hypothetical protein
VLLNAYFKRSLCFANVTSWDIVHTVLLLLDISNQSSFHQCPTECMFSFENGPAIKTVSNVSEFLENCPKNME